MKIFVINEEKGRGYAERIAQIYRHHGYKADIIISISKKSKGNKYLIRVTN